MAASALGARTRLLEWKAAYAGRALPHRALGAEAAVFTAGGGGLSDGLCAAGQRNHNFRIDRAVMDALHGSLQYIARTEVHFFCPFPIPE